MGKMILNLMGNRREGGVIGYVCHTFPQIREGYFYYRRNKQWKKESV